MKLQPTLDISELSSHESSNTVDWTAFLTPQQWEIVDTGMALDFAEGKMGRFLKNVLFLTWLAPERSQHYRRMIAPMKEQLLAEFTNQYLPLEQPTQVRGYLHVLTSLKCLYQIPTDALPLTEADVRILNIENFIESWKVLESCARVKLLGLDPGLIDAYIALHLGVIAHHVKVDAERGDYLNALVAMFYTRVLSPVEFRQYDFVELGIDEPADLVRAISSDFNEYSQYIELVSLLRLVHSQTFQLTLEGLRLDPLTSEHTNSSSLPALNIID